tara:strand:+ start:2905 stop:3324 length:420 start_codon:yes stop_codon:yes gene_type:complete
MLNLENINDINLYYTITLKKIAAKFCITFEQAKFLINIPYDGIILSSLSKHLGIDNSTLTRNINKLNDNHFVLIQKSKLDKRKKVIKLSSLGLETVSELEKLFFQELKKIKKNLTFDDVLEIKDALEKLNWALSCLSNE